MITHNDIDGGTLNDSWTFAAPLVLLKYKQWELGTASGFFWSKDDRKYLITNWHVLSGINPTSGLILADSGARPDRIVLGTYCMTPPGDNTGLGTLEYSPVEIAICDEDHLNEIWLEHPSHRRDVDVAAIDVTEHVKDKLVYCANQLETATPGDLRASEDMFVIGYPFGEKMVKPPAPVWRRATLAMDPGFEPDGLPKLLIDTTTRNGMSGSVVIARRTLLRRESGSSIGIRHMEIVAGVYSSRLYPDLEKAQIGITWKRSTIDETIAGGRLASC